MVNFVLVQLLVIGLVQLADTANYPVKIGGKLVGAQPIIDECVYKEGIYREPNPPF